jgi:transposase InsO family protein
MRSKLPASEFAALVGVTATTLYGWRKRFEELGPAALLGHKRGQRGSQLPEPTRRAILMMKQAHPEWGQDRIHDMLIRTEGLEASARAVQRVLLEAGYEVEEAPTRPHPPKATRFERTRPNELWQTDLFSFLLKRQRCRVHLVAYLDDFSRFVVGFGLHASASGALVREVLEQAIANFGAPEEVLCDNGAQYHTWRGKSAFAKLCERRGIRQIVASPRRPQTLGKIERFWGTLWRELVEGAIFRDLEEARTRLKHFLGYYNFQRTHQGIDGLVPADRYFEAAPEVREALEKRVSDNAKALALHGEPRKGVYLTGRVGGEPISLHTEGTKVVLTGEQGVREEVDLSAPGRRLVAEPEAPGTSVLDGVLEELAVRESPTPQEASDTDPDDTRDEKEAS